MTQHLVNLDSESLASRKVSIDAHLFKQFFNRLVLFSQLACATLVTSCNVYFAAMRKCCTCTLLLYLLPFRKSTQRWGDRERQWEILKSTATWLSVKSHASQAFTDHITLPPPTPFERKHRIWTSHVWPRCRAISGRGPVQWNYTENKIKAPSELVNTTICLKQ